LSKVGFPRIVVPAAGILRGIDFPTPSVLAGRPNRGEHRASTLEAVTLGPISWRAFRNGGRLPNRNFGAEAQRSAIARPPWAPPVTRAAPLDRSCSCGCLEIAWRRHVAAKSTRVDASGDRAFVAAKIAPWNAISSAVPSRPIFWRETNFSRPSGPAAAGALEHRRRPTVPGSAVASEYPA